MTKNGFPENLVSKRLYVRPFLTTDINDIYVGWLNDDEVVRFSNQRFLQHTYETCLNYLLKFKGSSNHFLAIVDRETSHMVGTMTVYCNVHHQTADIGMMVGNRDVWGRGLGLEAFSLILRWLADRRDIRKITAGTLACNNAMVRILERSGMSLEAVRRGHEIVDGKAEDIVYYVKFKDA